MTKLLPPVTQSQSRRPKLTDTKEAADRLDVKPETVRRAIHNGELRALRLGENGRYRILERDLQA